MTGERWTGTTCRGSDIIIKIGKDRFWAILVAISLLMFGYLLPIFQRFQCLACPLFASYKPGPPSSL